MDIVILALKIFGIYLIVSGLFLIFKRKLIPLLLKDFFGHPAIMYLTGIILIFLSAIYLLQYSSWGNGWEVVVTVFVWLVALKGLLYIFAPKALERMSTRKFGSFFVVYGFIALIVGLYLMFFL